MFSQVKGGEGERDWELKGQVEGGFGGQMFAASRRAEPQARCGGSIGRVLGGLRNGEIGAREAFWDSRIGARGHLTGGLPRRLGSGSSRGARMSVKGVL